MMRNVYLQGELGDRFGKKFQMSASTPAEIIKCINANRDGFRPFLLECHEKGVAFNVKIEEKDVVEEEFILPLKKGDVTISLIPAGSKSGLSKILAAILIVTIALPALAGAPSAAVGPNLTLGEKIAMGAAKGIKGKILVGLATNLALVGLQQVLAQDPSTDSQNPTNYLFDGDAQNTKRGDPVPVLYGELRVPGRPISIDIIAGEYTNPVSIVNADNELIYQDDEKQGQGF